jgi:hypothetical protein
MLEERWWGMMRSAWTPVTCDLDTHAVTVRRADDGDVRAVVLRVALADVRVFTLAGAHEGREECFDLASVKTGERVRLSAGSRNELGAWVRAINYTVTTAGRAKTQIYLNNV